MKASESKNGYLMIWKREEKKYMDYHNLQRRLELKLNKNFRSLDLPSTWLNQYNPESGSRTSSSGIEPSETQISLHISYH